MAQSNTDADRPRRKRYFSNSSMFAAFATIFYGAFVAIVVLFSDSFNAATLSFIAEWFGLFCGIYIICELVPIALKATQASDPDQILDIISSPLATAVIFLVIPAVYWAWGIWPNYWARKIWLTAIPFGLIDLLLILVLYKISRGIGRVERV